MNNARVKWEERIEHGFASIEATITFIVLVPSLLISLGLIDYFLVLRSFDSTVDFTSAHFNGKAFAVRSGAYFHTFLPPVMPQGHTTEVDRRISFGSPTAYDQAITQAVEDLRKRIAAFFVENGICPNDSTLDACTQWRHYIEIRHGLVAIDRESGITCLQGRTTLDCGRKEGALTRYYLDHDFNREATGSEPLRDLDISLWVRGARSFAYSGAVNLRSGVGRTHALRTRFQQYVERADDPLSASALAIPTGLNGTTTYQYYGNADGEVAPTEASRHREFLAFSPLIGVEVQVDISDASGIKLLRSFPGMISVLQERGTVHGTLLILSRIEIWSPRKIV